MIDISIIIPVYNTEQYLMRCVDSIIAQSYKSYEIILVDDGSTDNSPSICNKYAETYSFIKTLHIKNSGPATAKNAGYDAACGKYIYYADSDDELHPQMLESMIILANKYNADIVCCNYLQIDEAGNRSHEEHTGNEYVFNKEEAMRHFLKKDMIYSQCWTKMYKSNMLKKNNIRFENGLKTEEDSIYNIYAFLVSDTIAITDKPLYIYTHRNCSLSREYHHSHMERFIKNMTYRLTLADDLINKEIPSLKTECCTYCLFYYNLMIGRAVAAPYSKIKKQIKPALNYIYKHRYTLFYNHSRCGLSFTGALLLAYTPFWIYYKYRHNKTE